MSAVIWKPNSAVVFSFIYNDTRVFLHADPPEKSEVNAFILPEVNTTVRSLLNPYVDGLIWKSHGFNSVELKPLRD